MSRNRFIALSIVLDALLVNAGYVLAFLLRFGGNLPAFNFGAYLFLAPFITVLYIAGAWTYGLYDPERSDTAWLDRTRRRGGGHARCADHHGHRVLRRRAHRVVRSYHHPARLGARPGAAHGLAPRLPAVRATQVARAQGAHRGRPTPARWSWPSRSSSAASGAGGSSGLIDPSVGSMLDRGPRGRRLPGAGLRRPTSRASPPRPAPTASSWSAPSRCANWSKSLVLADEVSVRVDVVPELYEIFIGTVDAIVGDVPLMEITRSTVPALLRGGQARHRHPRRAVPAHHHEPHPAPRRHRDRRDRRVSPALLPGAQRQEPQTLPVYKLRTMRKDAEKLTGPVLAEEDDPRITKSGTLFAEVAYRRAAADLQHPRRAI